MKLKSPLKLHIRLHGCIVTTKYEVDLLDVFISDIKIVLWSCFREGIMWM